MRYVPKSRRLAQISLGFMTFSATEVSQNLESLDVASISITFTKLQTCWSYCMNVQADLHQC